MPVFSIAHSFAALCRALALADGKPKLHHAYSFMW